jgi:DNA-binding MarR family transcriptional regulator
MELRQDSLGFLLADVFRLMRRAFQQRLEDGALTPAQGRALVYISRHEGIRQVDLAKLLEVQPITLARLVDQLAESGVVERRPDPADRRAYQVFLTPAAASHLATIEQVFGNDPGRRLARSRRATSSAPALCSAHDARQPAPRSVS